MQLRRSKMIDNFEPYFEKIAAFHNPLYEMLLNMDFVKKETKQFCLQCNYTEYVEEDHDKEYEWFRFYFDDDQKKDFALGINKLRFQGREDKMNQIKEKVENLWKNTGAKLTYAGIISDVSAMKKGPWEMIMSVHYWFDMALIDDGINDSQYLKIVYTGTSMDGKVEKL